MVLREGRHAVIITFIDYCGALFDSESQPVPRRGAIAAAGVSTNLRQARGLGHLHRTHWRCAHHIRQPNRVFKYE